MGKCIEFDA